MRNIYKKMAKDFLDVVVDHKSVYNLDKVPGVWIPTKMITYIYAVEEYLNEEEDIINSGNPSGCKEFHILVNYFGINNCHFDGKSSDGFAHSLDKFIEITRTNSDTIETLVKKYSLNTTPTNIALHQLKRRLTERESKIISTFIPHYYLGTIERKNDNIIFKPK